MSWARLDDGFWVHPKVLIVGNTAAGVFARMLSYCGCYLTDGLVPDAIVNTITGSDKKALAALVTIGLIERSESGSVYICDYLDHNPTKDEVEEKQRQRVEAGRLGGQAKAAASAKAKAQRGLHRAA